MLLATVFHSGDYTVAAAAYYAESIFSLLTIKAASLPETPSRCKRAKEKGKTRHTSCLQYKSQCFPKPRLSNFSCAYSATWKLNRRRRAREQGIILFTEQTEPARCFDYVTSLVSRKFTLIWFRKILSNGVMLRIHDARGRKPPFCTERPRRRYIMRLSCGFEGKVLRQSLFTVIRDLLRVRDSSDIRLAGIKCIYEILHKNACKRSHR